MKTHFALSHIALLGLSALLFTTAGWAEVQFSPALGARVLNGEDPHLVITGLKPGEQATVHAFRIAPVYAPGGYTSTNVLAHADAVYTADATGILAIDSAPSLRGTYSGVDPFGLLWSGTRLPLTGDPALAITRDLHLDARGDVVFRVEAPSLGEHWAETRIHLTDGADTVDLQPVDLPGLNGVLARPKARAATSLPAILLLHGSEGGSQAEARVTAIRFAHLGYAALAINYFAWPGTGLTDVPQALVNVPVEQLAVARTWLMAQPGVDARKIAIWGASKGAEFALVGASHYDWVDRVVACVPSNVVWSGFGRAAAAGEVYSSWSIAGKGLPFIPYDNYQEVLDGKHSAVFIHERSLTKVTPQQIADARIPIEKSVAKILLLAATNDVVWPSGTMSRAIEAGLQGVHTDAVVHSIVFANASHFICGTGTDPRRINPVHKPEGDDPTPEADAHAAEVGWRATQDFLRR